MNWISVVWQVLMGTSRWMAWNLFLALVPFGLSIWLFRLSTVRSLVWWVGLFLFVAFLPNAPYVLTDLIHLIRDIQLTDSLAINILVILPKYLLFILIGFESYVLCLINLGIYLKRQNLNSWVPQVELVLHALSAIGIYLGRIERLNSWDIVFRPHHVLSSVAENLLNREPLIFMTIALLTISGLYWLLKQLTLAVLLQRHYSKTLAQHSNSLNQ
ncbi:DUF1361 domain-containing protein [Kovacikia minuta CCNUW1]|uniref:DUF1361 domain-containing protein n=1 Tax=Kovacikia minuta TaxID=2931930 RepID=UPI001CCA3BCA|nr:DUF1361 domain-containing protein [Kovacikia minuta]UBF27228.1 DUF1361 domain-containing protein [Kovacikia minuta CCNUW1]